MSVLKCFYVLLELGLFSTFNILVVLQGVLAQTMVTSFEVQVIQLHFHQHVSAAHSLHLLPTRKLQRQQHPAYGTVHRVVHGQFSQRQKQPRQSRRRPRSCATKRNAPMSNKVSTRTQMYSNIAVQHIKFCSDTVQFEREQRLRQVLFYTLTAWSLQMKLFHLQLHVNSSKKLNTSIHRRNLFRFIPYKIYRTTSYPRLSAGN